MQLAYKSVDYTMPNAMREFVKSELSNMDLSEKSAGTLWFSFNAVMQQAIDKFMPHTSVTNKPKNQYG